jgi:hypothetical protein
MNVLTGRTFRLLGFGERDALRIGGHGNGGELEESESERMLLDKHPSFLYTHLGALPRLSYRVLS